MSKKNKKRSTDRTFTAPDGTTWMVDVTLPSHSSAMVVFAHPDGRTARNDRYNWYNANVPEARNVEGRLEPKAVLDALTDEQVALLFRRSMPVHANDDPARALGMRAAARN
jgi:hypothetical protein